MIQSLRGQGNQPAKQDRSERCDTGHCYSIPFVTKRPTGLQSATPPNVTSQDSAYRSKEQHINTPRHRAVVFSAHRSRRASWLCLSPLYQANRHATWQNALMSYAALPCLSGLNNAIPCISPYRGQRGRPKSCAALRVISSQFVTRHIGLKEAT